jgi:hypothetical protein
MNILLPGLSLEAHKGCGLAMDMQIPHINQTREM